MTKMIFSTRTDSQGYFQETQCFNPPGPFDLSVKLSARLKKPRDTTVLGSIDIDAADGNPTNQERKFRIGDGEKHNLGQWSIDGGDNIVIVRGKTEPTRPETMLTVEISARLGRG